MGISKNDVKNPSFHEWMDFAARKTGAQVSFEDLAGVTFQIPALALRHDQYLHDGAYCRHMKSHGGLAFCSTHKNKVVALSGGRREDFSGCCPRGIWDHVHPVFFRGEPVGVFFLGGFRKDRALEKNTVEKFPGPLPEKITAEKEKMVAEFARHLSGQLLLQLEWWTDQGNTFQKKKPAGFYVRSVKTMVSETFHQPLRLSEVARRLGVHPNHLSFLLVQETGKNFRRLLLEERLERVKAILSASPWASVTLIAAKCGFNDRNYLSAAFKRETGMSLREFQKKYGDKKAKG